MSRSVPFGVFLPVGDGGFIMSSTSPSTPGTYAYNKEVTVLAEQLGMGFVVSMARWRGWEGATNHWKRTFESMTASAGFAEATEKIRIFTTVQTNAFHPAVAAKMISTIDEISGGRVGLNLVAGSSPVDHGQMGIAPNVSHAELYEIAAEWITVAKALWAADKVDFDGTYYHLTDCWSNPKPLQQPHPPILCAATSDTGIRFTIDNATATLMNAESPEGLIAAGQRAKQIAAEMGRTVQTVGLIMMVPAESDEAAQARVDLYNDGADTEALFSRAFEFSQSAKEFSQDEARLRQARQLFAEGRDTPLAVTRNALVGTPERIARELAQVVLEGDLDWVGFYLPDYIKDLEIVATQVLPLLPQYGIEPTIGNPSRPS